MRYLLLSSLLLVFYCCAPAKRHGVPSMAQLQDISLFQDTTGAYLYKNKINIFGRYLSGLMLIKPLGGNDYKVAITTEFGAKILDFEMIKGQFKLNDCISELKRKIVLNILETDMKILLGVQKFSPIVSQPSDTLTHYTFKERPFSNVYAIDTTNKLVSINSYRRKRNMVSISITEYVGQVPKTVLLQHFGLPVTIEMNLVKAPGNVAP